MRLRGRQARFLVLVFACWGAARAYLLWPVPYSPEPFRLHAASISAAGGIPDAHTIAGSLRRDAPQKATSLVLRTPKAIPLRTISTDGMPDAEPAFPPGRAAMVTPSVTAASRELPAPTALFPPIAPRSTRIEAQAYLFWRPGGSILSLADHGELGGSQIAARIAVPIARSLAVAARLYAPIEHPGAEGAIGIDWHPTRALPLRLGFERRQRLDRQGRSAWSAYMAGGFYRGGGPGTAQFDGYAQAGIVGTRRRDGFIDGAFRIGYRLPPSKVTLIAGGGIWGAAQPQVSRLDAGPRLSLTIPIDHHSITLAVDGRVHIAGEAAPGSSAAVTLAADF